MVSEVKRKLESVCCGKGWCYGVFWRFDRRNPMLLTVEDTFCEDQMEAVLHNIHRQVQLLGEGSIGQAAFTGKHRWMFCDARNEQCSPKDRMDSQSLLLGDAELHRQFSNGIKTIAVIPVERKGVLQFGSRKKILEKLEHLQYLKMPFEMTNRVPPFNSDPSNINALFASFLSTQSSFWEDVKPNGGNGDKGLSTSAVLTQSSSPHFPSIYSRRTSYEQPISPRTFPIKVEPTEAACISSCAGDFSVITSVESPLPTRMLVRDSHDLSCGDMLKNSLAETRSASSGQKRPFQEVKTAEEFADNTFTIDDLSQWFADLPGDDSAAAAAADYTCEEAPVENNAPPSEDRMVYTESAREDVFSVSSDCWGDYSTNSCPMDLDGSWKGVLAQLGMEEDMLMSERCTVSSKQLKAGNFSCAETMNVVSSAKDLSCGRDLQGKLEIFPKSSIEMWIDDSYSNNNHGEVVARICKTEEPKRAPKRRARPGESIRPRPKDRQLIQDRLKELRGMIPNGAKCSIDALLDRTVKHMQFLQNVTKYAERLRQAKLPKLINPVKRSSSRGSDDGGATWAFEVGSQTVECPVIVEDLDSRGQMLIEMVCDGQGLSLEIANTVRDFGLDILKGEMEVRDGKLWSCFIVEANRPVTRMDVFWSLVQLLQKKDAVNFEHKVEPRTDLMDGQIGVIHCNDYKQSVQSLPINLTEMFR